MLVFKTSRLHWNVSSGGSATRIDDVAREPSFDKATSQLNAFFDAKSNGELDSVAHDRAARLAELPETVMCA